jgi:hypothetical protein
MYGGSWGDELRLWVWSVPAAHGTNLRTADYLRSNNLQVLQSRKAPLAPAGLFLLGPSCRRLRLNVRRKLTPPLPSRQG